MSDNKRIVTYKCPFCDLRFDRMKLVGHLEEKHDEMIPEDFTPFRYVFNYVNKRPLSYHGKCTECGGPTPWDENKGRYDRQCEKKACKDSYLKKFEENMMKTRGVTRMSASKDGQVEMLSKRKISGTYVFQDGGKRTYTGSYEKKALEFMDKVLEIKSKDIMSPGPILEYSYKGQTKIYITDFYYQPYNLIIEVKDGGSNPNKRNMPEYREKQIAKEQFIIKHTTFNYLRLTDNDFSQLLSTFAMLKFRMVENMGDDRVININESNCLELDDKVNPLSEWMNALNTGKVPGLFDSGSCYLAPYRSLNTVFAGEDNSDIGLTASLNSSRLVYIDKETNKLVSGEKDDVKLEGNFYKLNMSLSEATDKLFDHLNEVVVDHFIYETLTGKKLYDNRQLEYLYEGANLIDFYNMLKIPVEIRESLLPPSKSKYQNYIDEVNRIIKESVEDA